MSTKKEMLALFLSDSEKAELKAFINNKPMANAIKKVLLFDIYNNGTLKAGENPDPTRNFALQFAFMTRDPNSGIRATDAELGADLRAVVEGVCLVENAYGQLAAYKEEDAKPEKKTGNKAI